MPLLMCGDSISQACNCCGCVGTKCCAPGKEGCCSCFNNCCCFGPCCCECCPCGSNGCLGYSNHLCGCCGNCNLMCYSGCCEACFLADLHIATISDREEAAAEWSRVMCTVVSLGLLMTVFSSFWPEGDQKQPDFSDTNEAIFYALGKVGDIFGIICGVYVAVIFGKAATAIAAKTGVEYEPAECCTKCCSDETCCAGCCPSCTCCCTYWCCSGCHALQVARSFEGSEELVSNVVEGRPESCRCCNCWVQPGVGTETADAAGNAL